jgi:hypothetical protein
MNMFLRFIKKMFKKKKPKGFNLWVSEDDGKTWRSLESTPTDVYKEARLGLKQFRDIQ